MWTFENKAEEVCFINIFLCSVCSTQMNLCLNHNLLPLLLCTNNKQKQTEWLLQIGEQAMFSCSSTTGTCSLFASIISYIQLQPWLSHYHYAALLGSFIKANGLALATYTQLCSCLQPGHKTGASCTILQCYY